MIKIYHRHYRVKAYILLIGLLACMGYPCGALKALGQDTLDREVFKDPPKEYRPWAR